MNRNRKEENERSAAEKAKQELDGFEFRGHTLRVSAVGPPKKRGEGVIETISARPWEH